MDFNVQTNYKDNSAIHEAMQEVKNKLFQFPVGSGIVPV